jgi:hypothetical protein
MSGEFHKRVMKAIHAEIRRSGTYPNALYVGDAEYAELLREARGLELLADPSVTQTEFAGLNVFRVCGASHFGVAWLP